MKVGGFYQMPRKSELLKLAEDLKEARDAAQETVRWVSSFNFPVLERDYECVSLPSGRISNGARSHRFFIGP